MNEIKFELFLRRKDGSDSYYEHLTLDELINRNGCLFNPDIWEVVYKRQYTGINDKNKKEIYEGDILLLESFIDDKTFTVPVTFEDGMFVAKGSGLLCHYGDKFIIGNIYENPELIKGSYENDKK
jgi:uncharacterized phage protein (TIGR01671 family)